MSVRRFINSSVFSALWGQSTWPYIFFRLRYFMATILCNTVTNSFELFIIINNIHLAHKSEIILLRMLPQIFIQVGWGLCETLRNNVRFFYNSKNLKKVTQLRSQWLSLSIIMAIVLLLSLCCYCLINLFNNNLHFDITTSFIVATVLLTALHFVYQVLHSSIYGFRRIYRPFWSMNLGHIIGLGVLVAFFHLFSVWAILFSYIVESIVTLLLGFYFCHKMLKKLHQPIWQRFNLPAIKSLLNFYNFFCCCNAIFLQLLPILFIFILIKNYFNAYYFYACMPLLMATFSWYFLFYFDKKRFADHLKPLLSSLNKSLYIINVAIILMLMITTIAAMKFLTVNSIEYVVVIPFFVVHANFAMKQFDLYCDNEHLVLFVGFTAFIASYIIWSFFSVKIILLIALITIVEMLFLFWASLIKKPVVDKTLPRNVWLPLNKFRHYLKNSATLTTIHRLHFKNSKQVNGFIKNLRKNDHQKCYCIYENVQSILITENYYASSSALKDEQILKHKIIDKINNYINSHRCIGIAKHLKSDKNELTPSLFKELSTKEQVHLSVQLFYLFKTMIYSCKNSYQLNINKNQYKVIPIYENEKLCHLWLKKLS